MSVYLSILLFIYLFPLGTSPHLVECSSVCYPSSRLISPHLIPPGVFKAPWLAYLPVREAFAERLLLTTRWMVQSKQQLGKPIVDRFKAAQELRPGWSTAHFELARYLERLAESKGKEMEACGALSGERLSTSQLPMEAGSELGLLQAYAQYLLQALEQFGKALQHGGGEHVSRSLPRMLTLWFSFTALRDSDADFGSKSGTGGMNNSGTDGSSSSSSSCSGRGSALTHSASGRSAGRASRLSLYSTNHPCKPLICLFSRLTLSHHWLFHFVLFSGLI
jgi:hypothetical protein